MSDPLARVLAAHEALTAAYAAAAVAIKAMDEDERRRWDAGRHDWERERWEDHCGLPDCGDPCCAGNLIPERNRMVEAQRAALVGALKARELL